MCGFHFELNEKLKKTHQELEKELTPEIVANGYAWLVKAGWIPQTDYVCNFHEMKSVITRLRWANKGLNPKIPHLNDSKFDAIVEQHRAKQEEPRIEHFNTFTVSEVFDPFKAGPRDWCPQERRQKAIEILKQPQTE